MKKKFVVGLATGLLISGMSMIAEAIPILDQESPGSLDAQFNGSNIELNWQQEVSVGINGRLTSVALYAFYFGVGSFDFYINTGTGWQTDSNDFSSTFTAPHSGWFDIDVSSANIRFSANDHFVFGIKGIGGNFFLGGNVGLYQAGNLLLNGSNNWGDLGFKTYMDSAPVPEPATMLLFGTGIAGLAAVGRRKRS